MALTTCNSCRRHVRDEESACPFCGGALGRAVARPVQLGRRHRGAIMFAVAVAGCSGTDESNPVPLYGVPFDAAQLDTSAGDAATVDSAIDTAANDSATTDSGTTDSARADVIDAADTADAEETRIFPPYGAPSTPIAV